MRFLENRRLAWIILLMCALASVVLLGGGGLSAERRELERVFVKGAASTPSVRTSMDAYLDKCADSASLLAETAKLYLTDTESIETVSHLSGALSESDGADGRYAIFRQLSGAVESLYTQLCAANAQDETDVLLNYGDFKGAVDRMERDEYHAMAQRFNEDLSAFPANLLGKLFGVEKLDTYGW